jgi:hypothetical protein
LIGVIVTIEDLMANFLSLIFVVIYTLPSLAGETSYRILYSFKAPVQRAAGLAYDGKNFWTFDGKAMSLVAFNTNGVKLRQIPLGENSTVGVAYDGKNLQAINVRRKSMVTVDPREGIVLSEQNLPLHLPTGLYFVGNKVFICDSVGVGSINIFNVNGMKLERQVPAPGQDPFGVTLHEGCLYVSDTRPPVSDEPGRIYCLDTTTYEPLKYINFTEGGRATVGLAWEQECLWAIAAKGAVYCLVID